MSTIYQPFLIVTTNYSIVRKFVNPENKLKSFAQLVEENKQDLESESVLLSPLKNTRYFESFDYNIGYDKSEMFAINLHLADVDYDFEEYFIEFVFQEERYRDKIKKSFVSKKLAEINSLGTSGGGSVFSSDSDLLSEAQRTIKSKLSGYIYFIFGINDRASTPIVSQFYKSEVSQTSEGFKKLKLNFINLGHPSLVSELSQIDVDRSNFKVVEQEGFKKYEIYKFEGVIHYKKSQDKLDLIIRTILRNLFTRVTGQEIVLLLPDFNKLFEKYKSNYVPRGFLRIFTTPNIPNNSPDLEFLNSEFYQYLVFSEYLKELGFVSSDPLLDSSALSPWLTDLNSAANTVGDVAALQQLDDSLNYYQNFEQQFKRAGFTESEERETLDFLNSYEGNAADWVAEMDAVENGVTKGGRRKQYDTLKKLKDQGKLQVVLIALEQRKKLEESLLKLAGAYRKEWDGVGGTIAENWNPIGAAGTVVNWVAGSNVIPTAAEIWDSVTPNFKGYTTNITEKIQEVKAKIVQQIKAGFKENHLLSPDAPASEKDWNDANFVQSVSPVNYNSPIEFYIIEKGKGTSDLDDLMPQKGNHINFDKFIADFSKKIAKIDQNFDYKIGFFEENDLNRLLLLKSACAYQTASSFLPGQFTSFDVLKQTLTLTATSPLPSGYPSTSYGPINRNYEILKDITNELRPTNVQIKGRLSANLANYDDEGNLQSSNSNPPLLREGQNVSRITFLNTTIMDAGGQIVPLGQNIQYPGTSVVTITRKEAVYDQYDLDAFILSKPQNQAVKQQLQDLQRYSQDLERQANTARDTYRGFLRNPGQFVTVAGQPIPAAVYWRREYIRLFQETIESKNRYEEVIYDLLARERPNLVRVLEQKMSKDEWDIFERTGQGRQFPTTIQEIQNYNSSVWTWDGEYLPDQLAPGLSRVIEDETRPAIVIADKWLVENLYYPTTVVKDDYLGYPISEEDKLNYGVDSRYTKALKRRRGFLSSVYKKNFLNSSFGEDVVESDILNILSDETKKLASESLFSTPVFTYNFKNSNILSFNLEVDKLNHTVAYHNLIQFQQKGIINEALEPIRRDIYDKITDPEALYKDLDAVLNISPDPVDVDELVDLTTKKLIGDTDEYGNEISLNANAEQDMLIDDLAKNANIGRSEYIKSIASRLVDDYIDDLVANDPKSSSLIKGTDQRLNPMIKRLNFMRDLYTKMYNITIKTLPFYDLNNMERLYSGAIVLIKNIPNVVSTPKNNLSYLTGMYRIKGFRHVINTTSAYSEFTLFKDPVVGQIEL